ncbi:DUF4870 domain-containing protein [Microbacterium sp. ASV49]|uniref:DUF4870 domain-containing protein n=1 Tax=Microbacterium candidum TaxID=3041922 RepID=A0ABT7MY93_9MICO|nr:DUF4870 domain-containing protein [Microbacterium sp. ASV49]MDL9979417.1 DUF4870 domain-containing protein [Microbacterium sp. ASV49]
MATPPPPQPPYGGAAQQPMTPSDEKLWAILIQVGGLLFGFIPALIGYLVLKDRGPFIRSYSATALNFQLTLLIAYVVGWVLSVVVIGFIILAAVWVVNIVFSIIAAVKANNGEWYTYPMSIPFVK